MSDNTNEIILEVKDLKKSFGDHVVLESINTTVRKGEVIAIIGPSGCGKSTFLRSLNLLETPTEGHVLFHEQDLTDKSVNVDELREKIVRKKLIRKLMSFLQEWDFLTKPMLILTS